MPIEPKLFIKTGTRGQSKFSQIFDYETGFNLSNAIQRTKSVTKKNREQQTKASERTRT